MRIHFLTLFFSLLSTLIIAQEFSVGNAYFDDQGYAEYIHGNLPIILSAPHGGEKKPDDIPDRSCPSCVTINDTNTQELAREVAAELLALTGCQPYVVLNRLHRSKLDANREINEAADGNEDAEKAWQYFHDQIKFAQADITANFGKGLFLDLHGHGHEIQRLELGYLLSRSSLEDLDGDLDDKADMSSIRNLANDNLLDLKLTDLLQGAKSFGELMEDSNVDAVPSQTDPYPISGEPYFTGGYNTRQYGSSMGGTVDGIQIECHQDVRFQDDKRKEFAKKLAAAILDYMVLHYNEDFESSVCMPVSNTAIADTKIEYYPNPATNELKVYNLYNYTELHLYDLFGRQILIKKVDKSELLLDLSSYASGAYTVVLLGGNDNYSFPFFIQN